MARGAGRGAAKAAEGVIARVARAVFKAGKKKGVRTPSGLRRAASGGSRNPFDMVPPGTKPRPWKPGRVKNGTEYSFRNANGDRVTVRAHGRDPGAPPGSNASQGPVYRVQIGPDYVGQSGRRYPPSSLNPDHPNYDPRAANDTHIPWPPHTRLPWE